MSQMASCIQLHLKSLVTRLQYASIPIPANASNISHLSHLMYLAQESLIIYIKRTRKVNSLIIQFYIPTKYTFIILSPSQSNARRMEEFQLILQSLYTHYVSVEKNAQI